MPIADDIKAHYSRVSSEAEEFAERILAAITTATGTAPEAVTALDLAPFDNLHIGGADSTRDLTDRAGFPAGAHILDVGCGIGGPARILAAEGGHSVIGLDLTPVFVATANLLSERVGLGGRTRFVEGSALDVPFEDASFDAAWTQHAAMNIEDKPTLYDEVFRVLKPGGRFALHDITAGPNGPPHYPCPWASDPAWSFLVTNQELRGLVRAAGFEEEFWEDYTDTAIALSQRSRAEREEREAAGLPPPPGPHLFMGEEIRTALANASKSLMSGKLCNARGVWRKPD